MKKCFQYLDLKIPVFTMLQKLYLINKLNEIENSLLLLK